MHVFVIRNERVKWKNIKKIQASLSPPISLSCCFCAGSKFQVGQNLGDSNRLDDLEYRWTANHKEEESQQPWSDAHLFIGGFLKRGKWKEKITFYYSTSNFSWEISTFALRSAKQQKYFFLCFWSPEQANVLGKSAQWIEQGRVLIKDYECRGYHTFWENYVVFGGIFLRESFKNWTLKTGKFHWDTRFILMRFNCQG